MNFKWKTKVVLHHTGVKGISPQYRSIFEYHNAGAAGKWKPGLGIQYHYFLEKKEDIVKCHNEDKVLYHSGHWWTNMRSIGICLAGDFTKESPSKDQIRNLGYLLGTIMSQRGMVTKDGDLDFSRIKLHREVKATKCPGTDLRKLAEQFIYKEMIKMAEELLYLPKNKKAAARRKARKNRRK